MACRDSGEECAKDCFVKDTEPTSAVDGLGQAGERCNGNEEGEDEEWCDLVSVIDPWEGDATS
ncbi:hypothetical protein ACHAXS_006120 [Conticribra weissflogii]